MTADYDSPITPPQSWRVIGDEPEMAMEVFLPIAPGTADRARQIAEAAAEMTPDDWADLAARYLAENYPDLGDADPGE